MKLRNRKTGEVATLTLSTNGEDMIIMGNDMLAHITKLSELKDYEDYEEPVKPYWFINDLDGEPMKCDLKNCGKSNFNEWSKHRKQIGNYFDTREEAEKAVEKLKAWKRLKDKGFEFINFPYKKICKYDARTGVGNLEYQVKYYEELDDDLDLLFGGEE